MVEVWKITTQDEWEACARHMDAGYEGDPYLNAAYQRAQLRREAEHGGPTCDSIWYIHGRDGDAGFACLWMHKRGARAGWPPKLTVGDWGVIAMPVVVPAKGTAASDALGALARSGGEIARATGVGVAGLHKIDAHHAGPLHDALDHERVPHHRQPFNTRWMLEIGDGVDAFLAQRSPKTRRGLRRSRRLLSEEQGAEPRAGIVRAGVDDGADLAAACDDVFRLRACNTDKCGDDVGAKAFRAFFEPVFASWRAQGTLWIARMWAGEDLVAAQVGLRMGDVLLLVLMEQDPRFFRFSPGILLLLEVLQDYVDEGIRAVDLGGAGDAWKEKWATRGEPTFSLTWPLGGVGGAAWRLRHRLRGGET